MLLAHIILQVMNCIHPSSGKPSPSRRFLEDIGKIQNRFLPRHNNLARSFQSQFPHATPAVYAISHASSLFVTTKINQRRFTVAESAAERLTITNKKQIPGRAYCHCSGC